MQWQLSKINLGLIVIITQLSKLIQNVALESLNLICGFSIKQLENSPGVLVEIDNVSSTVVAAAPVVENVVENGFRELIILR